MHRNEAAHAKDCERGALAGKPKAMPDRRIRLEAARLNLARIGMATPEDLRRALEQAAQVSAKTLGVSHVGVWLLSGETLCTCTVLYDTLQEGFRESEPLELSEYPAYFEALRTSRAIAADDAWKDPRTREMRASYLELAGVRAMLDVPILVAGQLVGVVCHEQVGQARAWTTEDIDFATSVADMLAVLIGQAARLRAEHALDVQEEILAEMRRMEALGRLAAGVAHDFSNVLLAISLLSQRLKLRLSEDPEGAKMAANIGSETDRGTRLVRQLLAFARQEKTTPVFVDLSEVVAGLMPLLETIVTSRHALALDTPEGPVTLRADRTQLEQIVMNLVTNARDALPDGGTIRVSVTETDENEAQLVVSDDGVGMDEETQSRVFEPFFTTKGGRGTGLGMSTVYGIVKQSNGHLELTSAPGEGTTVSIHFPRNADN